jgi:hypothetical protein
MSSNAPNNNPSNNNIPVQDSVKFGPNTFVVPSAFAALYRLTPDSLRTRMMAAIGSLGVTVPLAIYNQAIENPNGFNMLAHSYSEHRRTGH